MKITKDCVEHRFILEDAEPVEKQTGNGLRRIVPSEARVTVYSDGAYHVYLEGASILRSGNVGRYAGVSWSIGGRWDESSSAPEMVRTLVKLVEAVS